MKEENYLDSQQETNPRIKKEEDKMRRIKVGISSNNNKLRKQEKKKKAKIIEKGK